MKYCQNRNTQLTSCEFKIAAHPSGSFKDRWYSEPMSHTKSENYDFNLLHFEQISIRHSHLPGLQACLRVCNFTRKELGALGLTLNKWDTKNYMPLLAILLPVIKASASPGLIRGMSLFVYFSYKVYTSPSVQSLNSSWGEGKEWKCQS